MDFGAVGVDDAEVGDEVGREFGGVEVGGGEDAVEFGGEESGEGVVKGVGPDEVLLAHPGDGLGGGLGGGVAGVAEGFVEGADEGFDFFGEPGGNGPFEEFVG